MLHGANQSAVSLRMPTGARDQQIHLILEVRDDSADVPLTDYRRIVIDVAAHERWLDSPQGQREPNPLLPLPR